MDDEVLAAMVIIVTDAGDAAGRLARDFDRMANLLRSLLPEPGDAPTSLREVQPIE
jgi:hypothetical protein